MKNKEHAKPQPLKFLVLSDLHFGALSVSEEFSPPGVRPPGVMSSAVSMKESLIQVAKRENVSAIFVSGDLTSTGNPEEFVECMATITEIAQILNISTSNVIFTYGNHDVDWQISCIPGDSSSSSLKELYLKVGASLGDILLPKILFSDQGPVPGCGLVENEIFRTYVVNSGYFCSRDQKYSHGRIGDEQRTWLNQHLAHKLDEDKWNVLLLHHHPFNYRYPTEVAYISCLEEGALLMDLIGQSGIDFVCHGHRHHPKLFTDLRTGWDSPVTLLCAGSLAVNEQHRCQGQIPNLFHIVSLEKRLQNRTAVGYVKSFEYSSAEGWVDVRFCAHVPLDPVQKFAGVYDQSQREKDMAQVISTSKCKINGHVFELPKYDDLPLSLQCMHLQELNKMLRAYMEGQAQDYRIGGDYPDFVMVKEIVK